MAKAKAEPSNPQYYAVKTIAADGKLFTAGQELVGVRPGVLESMLRLGQATTDPAGAAALEELSEATTAASQKAAEKKAAKKAEAEKAEAEKEPPKKAAVKKAAEKKTAEAG